MQKQLQVLFLILIATATSGAAKSVSDEGVAPSKVTVVAPLAQFQTVISPLP